MTHPYPRHQDGFSYRGKYAYALNFGTVEQTTTFIEATVVDLVMTQFLRAARERGFEVTAYCFMPDHVHLVVTGERADSDRKAFVKAAKQYSGYYYKQASSDRLWRRYGYERRLRDEFERRAAIRYLLNNPVKARLATTPCDYPFIGSSRYTLAELLQLAGLPPCLPPEGGS